MLWMDQGRGVAGMETVLKDAKRMKIVHDAKLFQLIFGRRKTSWMRRKCMLYRCADDRKNTILKRWRSGNSTCRWAEAQENART